LKPTTAILLFSRTAKAEAKYKSIAVNGRDNIAAHTILINKTIATVEETGLPYFHIDEKQQSGKSFEEKLFDAFSQVFREGYENVLCIGSDSPQLNERHLIQSKMAVENGAACFGADNNGGVYLIAISQKHFKNGILSGINWNTAKVYSQLSANSASISCECLALPACQDINDQTDLRKIIESKEIANSLKWIIVVLLRLKNHFNSLVSNRLLKNEFKAVIILRGPPVYC
jgi:hypothetical protein